MRVQYPYIFWLVLYPYIFWLVLYSIFLFGCVMRVEVDHRFGPGASGAARRQRA